MDQTGINQQIDDEDDCGSAVYGGSGFVKDFKLKVADSPQGRTHNIFRIFPPLLQQKTTGKWRFYHQYHFGYYGTNKRDPAGKPIPQTFICPRKKNWQTKMVERDCAECKRIDEYKAQLETQKGAAKNQPPEAFRSILEPLVKWLKSHQFKAQNFLIAKDQSGQIGRLKIPARTGKALDDKFRELWETKQIDGTKMTQGVWVDIVRTGNGFSPDEIVIVTEQVNVPGYGLMDKIKPAPLTREEIQRAIQTCRDISDASPSVLLSDDQIEMLVNCDGQPETVDRIFALAQPNTPAPAAPPPGPAPAVAPQGFRPPEQFKQDLFAAPAPVTPPAPIVPPPAAPAAPAMALPPGFTPELMAQFLAFQQAQRPAAPAAAPAPVSAPAPIVPPPAPVVQQPARPAAPAQTAPQDEDKEAWLQRMMQMEG